MKTIITLTMNPTIDKSSAVENVVADRKLRCDPPRFEPGGGGVNVARAIRRLGGNACAWHTAGGPVGDMLIRLLEDEKVERNPIPIEQWTLENLMVMETSSERQYRFGMPGPKLTESEWRHVLDLLSGADPAPDYIVASGSLPRDVPIDFYARVAKVGKELGAKVVVDTSGDALCAALEEGVHLIKPNMRELRDVAGCELQSELEQEELLRRLVDQGKAEIVVVSLGAGGALAAWDGAMEQIRAPTVPIRSKVGAGDSMMAGMVFRLVQGRPVTAAVRYGIAAGASAVMSGGSELCRKEDTDRLYERLRTDE